MRALVTGSSGFVGRYMCAELESRGYQVHRVDIQNSRSSKDLHNAVNFFTADRRRYDLVVHCAYHVGGRATIDGVPSVLSANVELDAALFRWAERTQPRRVIYFSSSAAYPRYLQDAGYMPTFGRPLLHEDRIDLSRVDQPDARYGWAKLNGEMLAAAYREIGGAVTVVRPFSGYAHDQSEDYPFPSIVKRARQGDLTVWGPPGQTRDWIHITDVVKGALAVADSGTTDPVNLCTGVGTEMGDLAEMIARKAHSYDSYRFPGVLSTREYLTDKPTGVFYRVGDPTRMLQYYTPQVTLEQGITEALHNLQI